MSIDGTKERVRRMVAELVLVDLDEVTPDRLLVDELELDSLGFVELTFSIENELGVEFPDFKAREELSSVSLPDGIAQLATLTEGGTLLEYIAAEASRRIGLPPGELWDQTAATLAAALGGNVPKVIDPGVRLSALRLETLLRFLTVGTLVGYTEHLLRSKHEQAEVRE